MERWRVMHDRDLHDDLVRLLYLIGIVINEYHKAQRKTERTYSREAAARKRYQDKKTHG